jgi:hypothetical protein
VRPRTVTCPAAPDPASLLRRALALPRVSRLRTPPPCSGGLWCCHVSHGFRPRLPAREGSCAAMCHMAPDPASLLGGLRCCHVPHGSGSRLPVRRGLRCCHVSHGSGPHLPARESSDAATCSTAPDPASLLGSGGGGLRRCHVSRDPQRAADLKNKERLSCNHWRSQVSANLGSSPPCFVNFL